MAQLYIDNRKDWRDWLSTNFRKESEAWLVYPRKHTGKPRILYNDAVEEALCFGWIDSIINRVDDDHTMQRFTPRKPGSTFSQPNKERLKWLVDKGLIHAEILPEVEEILKEPFVFPPDILAAIKADALIWQNYQSFPDGYKRIRIAYIDAARKRPEEFDKRLNNFLLKTSQKQMIKGYGGIEKYY